VSFLVDRSAGLGLGPMIDILFGRDPSGFTVLLRVCGLSPLDVLVGLVATLLADLSTVLAGYHGVLFRRTPA